MVDDHMFCRPNLLDTACLRHGYRKLRANLCIHDEIRDLRTHKPLESGAIRF